MVGRGYGKGKDNDGATGGDSAANNSRIGRGAASCCRNNFS